MKRTPATEYESRSPQTAALHRWGSLSLTQTDDGCPATRRLPSDVEAPADRGSAGTVCEKRAYRVRSTTNLGSKYSGTGVFDIMPPDEITGLRQITTSPVDSSRNTSCDVP